MRNLVLDVDLEACLHRHKSLVGVAIGSAILSAQVKCPSGRMLSLKLVLQVAVMAGWLLLLPLVEAARCVRAIRATRSVKVLR